MRSLLLRRLSNIIMIRLMNSTLIAFLIISGCGKSSEDSNPQQPTALTFSEIQDQILSPGCVTGCHSNSVSLGGLNLEVGNSYSQLVNVSAVGNPIFKLVEPGNSSQSYLIFTLRGNNNAPKMPPTQLPALSTEKIQAIETWINGGAENN